jgi:hypothetical protein
MMPSGIWELLNGDSELESLGLPGNRIIESQSVDERPFDDGFFATIAFEERRFSTAAFSLRRGPRATTIAVHTPDEGSRDYAPINTILERITKVLSAIDQYAGIDNMEITEISIWSESANLVDEGYRTLTRYATYGVLYHARAT